MTSTDVRLEPPPRQPLPGGPPRRSSWHARANAVVLVWLALALAAAALGDPLALPRWLPVHLLLLGAVTNAAVTWSEHFAVALLRLPPPRPRWSGLRLAVLNTGVTAVLAGAVGGVPAVAVGGAVLVVGVAVGHTAVLAVRSRSALHGRFSYLARWYICSGAALAVGAALGAVLVSGSLPQVWQERLLAAHVHANLLGWVGLAVLGTLFTLWPTVLRTRIVEGTSAWARRSLPLAAVGLVGAVGALTAGIRWAAVVGLALYAAAAVLALVPLLRTARQRRPHSGASWTVAAGTGWFAIILAADVAVVATHPAHAVADALGTLLPPVLVGFVGQVLLGSLMFLLPVVLGGGPATVKRGTALVERWWLPRLIAVNAAVPLTVLPVPPWAETSAWALLLAGLTVSVALLAAAFLRSRGLTWHTPSPAVVGTALGAALSAVAIGVAGSGLGPATETEPVAATGGTRTVEVSLGNMTIDPGVVSVDIGEELVLRVRNDDVQAHDLYLDNGARTPMLDPGQSAVLEVGVVTGPMEGWCTVMGHRAAGMDMRVETGEGSDAGTDSAADGSVSGAESAHLDLSGEMSPDWRPYDAVLEPAPGGTEHEVEIRVEETELEVAPGVRQSMWTFNGSVPGPVLRGRVGDVFTVTFVNDGTMGHGIDFHAGSLAPDEPMRTIRPGERLTYRFRAEMAGAWLYHCSTAPMLQHLGNGMYGAVVVDPPDLEPVDREYLLVQGELYLGEPGGAEQVARMDAGEPDAWVFNGTAAGYDHAPLEAAAGERVRIWAVAAGPTSGTSLHVVGARFDTVYKEGAYRLRPGDDGGAQALDLAPAQGGFVETVFPEPGTYPFVDHDFRHGENGAHGLFEVTE
ncbi:multicopper oxidase domain-containing protein [Thermobifida halotolerans]|uniref:Copper-containing nitrite reductase n=1 Tax=Thermobifida halotolerans TaxID=483545 RepID=A0AA97LV26_9ACTN|nr:multicopper oxidase domain-containing protein [Thermobifida halotolerans]UOE18553.1 multicopper oxidase domain-containing protein [Thermobifida halotolerans]